MKTEVTIRENTVFVDLEPENHLEKAVVSMIEEGKNFTGRIVKVGTVSEGIRITIEKSRSQAEEL